MPNPERNLLLNWIAGDVGNKGMFKETAESKIKLKPENFDT